MATVLSTTTIVIIFHNNLHFRDEKTKAERCLAAGPESKC